MRRQSKFLFIVISVLLLFIAINFTFVYQFSQTIKDDAASINNLGRIRGAIQRYVKMQVAEMDSGLAESIANSALADFDADSTPYLASIKSNWIEIRNLAEKYRLDPTEEKKQLLLNESEIIWGLSEKMVLSYQLESESNLSYLAMLIVLLMIEFIFGLALLYIVKKYVYDNLESVALYDLLTGVYSRRFFFEQLKKEISKAERKDSVFSVIMFDIDCFKRVNDTYGHDKGDYVLKTVANIVKKTIRDSDVLCRIGGEEFTIILPDTPVDAAKAMAERARMVVEGYSFDTIGNITISLGVTTYNKDDTIDTIFKRADCAMYMAKNNGRNRVEVEVEVEC